MDANKLMVGDWVRILPTVHGRREYVTKVAGIGKDVLLYYNDAGHQTAGFERVVPIPLTIEILKLNGFEYGLTTEQEDILSAGLGVPVTVEKGWVYEDENGASVVMKFSNESDWVCIVVENGYDRDVYLFWSESIYVHDFQHVLRRCGLHDFADKLKIENNKE